MAFQTVKGMRDFYPQDMRKLNWIVETWRKVSVRNGFEEYDSPVFEYLDLFTAKSGPEIVEQLFSLTDRGGRQLAVRPEITPSLARMINAKISSLPRPIKWFSIPRVCRAEAPQQGRSREFVQWNVDIIGEDSELADAECVLVAVDCLREMGLSPEDVKVRYSSRAVLSEVLKSLRLPEASIPEVMSVLDKRSKLPPEAFTEMLSKLLPDDKAVLGILAFLNAGAEAGGIEQAVRDAGLEITEPMQAAFGRLEEFRKALRLLGIEDYCAYDTGIVRGLAYYTGIVYEIFDTKRELRAVAGGGRYDNLLQVLGGPKVGATGFGMGDPVLGILLEKKGLLPASVQSSALDYFVIDGEGATLQDVLAVVAAFRAKGTIADFSYKRQATGKQLQQANKRGAKAAVILKSGGAAAVKDLAAGTQRETTVGELLKE